MRHHSVGPNEHHAVGYNDTNILLQVQCSWCEGDIDQARIPLTIDQTLHLIELLKDAMGQHQESRARTEEFKKLNKI